MGPCQAAAPWAPQHCLQVTQSSTRAWNSIIRSAFAPSVSVEYLGFLHMMIAMSSKGESRSMTDRRSHAFTVTNVTVSGDSAS
jgi:hypothetical protein